MRVTLALPSLPKQEVGVILHVEDGAKLVYSSLHCNYVTTGVVLTYIFVLSDESV